MIVRGRAPGYAEVWRGTQDLGEDPGFTTLTGTVAIASGNPIITGTSTLFSSELVVGQWIIIDAIAYAVRRINSDTSVTVSPAPAATGSGKTAVVGHTLLDLDNRRAALARGSVLEFPKGHLLSVGQGIVKINGAALSASLTASNNLQLSKFNSSAGTYAHYTLGMAKPSFTTAVGVAGGVKNMQAGDYSLRLVPARSATGGFNNPSEALVVNLASTGDKFLATLPAVDAAAGQDAFRVYATLYSRQQSETGPWYHVARGTPAQDLILVNPRGTVAITSGLPGVTGTNTFFLEDYYPGDVVTIDGNSYTILSIASNTSMTLTANASTTASGQTVTITQISFEYRDAEISENDLIEFDNNAPPAAGFVATLGGLPVLLSCFGPNERNPGPVLAPAKPRNVEAFPPSARVAIDPPEAIIGVVASVGRLYPMTENRLHIATPSGDSRTPVSTRPFWKAGFRNSQSLIFVQGTLYGFTSGGPARSIAEGDEGIEEYRFAEDVAAVTKNWLPERVLVAHDPKNEAICFFHNNDNVNGAGKQYCNVLLYMLRLGVWSPVITIESSTVDIIVTGATVVAGVLYLNLLTRSGSTYTARTHQWDAGTNSINWYVASEFIDENNEGLITIEGVAVRAHTNGGSVGIHGPRTGDDIPVVDLQNSNASSESGPITLPASTAVKEGARSKIRVKDLRSYAVRIDGTFSGTGELHRVDEVVIDGMIEHFDL